MEASSCRYNRMHKEQAAASSVWLTCNVMLLCLIKTAGFFTSFTVPKLYSCYSSQIHKRGAIQLPLVILSYFFVRNYSSGRKAEFYLLLTSVEILGDRALEAWKSCPRKKLVAATAVAMFWNMFSVKTRVMAGIFYWHGWGNWNNLFSQSHLLKGSFIQT